MPYTKEEAEERRAEEIADEKRNAGGEIEKGPSDDPRSRYGHPADWNFPRGYGGL